MSASATSLTIYFYSMDGIGHLNACLGMAQALARRGHAVSFLINETVRGAFAKFGFAELLLKKSSSEVASKIPEKSANFVKQNAENLRKAGFLGPGSTLEKMTKQCQLEGENEFIYNFYLDLLVFDGQIERYLKQGQPDLVIVDAFLIPVALQRSAIPWAFLCSCNPLAIVKSPRLPPHASGYSTSADPASWSEYRSLFSSYKYKLFSRYQEQLDAALGYVPSLPIIDNDILFPQSPYLNIYGFPRELDYTDIEPLPGNFVTVDAFFREDVTTTTFKLPQELLDHPGTHLVYLSLGSMGSIEIDLMKRILAVLARTPYKYIVSKGPRAEEFTLPANCWGAAYLPQTTLLPQVDCVITHGGNNTVTEAFALGKPLIVMPLFGDQPDNAQRVAEKGFGVRLDPYEFQDEELIQALDRLLGDEDLKVKLEAAKNRIAMENSKEVACQKIEQLVESWKDSKGALGA